MSTRTIVQNWRLAFAFFTMVLDSVSIVISLFIGYLLNFTPAPATSFIPQQWKLILFSLFLYVLLNAVFGAYRHSYVSHLRFQLVVAAKSWCLGTLVIFATLFLFKNTYYSQGALLTYTIILPVIFLLGRILWLWVRRMLHGRKWAFEPAILLTTNRGDEYANNSAVRPGAGLDIRATVGMSLPDMETALDKHNVHTIVFAGESLEPVGTLRSFCFVGGRELALRIVTPEIQEALASARVHDNGGIAYAVLHRPVVSGIEAIIKRVFDVIASVTIIIIALPLLIAIAILIKIETPGTVLFRQVRALSKASPRISVYKFRSMRNDAEELRESNGGMKVADDPRITRIGRCIRKFSLDELPQLINVLKGEMSLVGPRPLPLVDFETFVSDESLSLLYDRRASVKPGITGVWQVSGRSKLNFRKMVFLDLYYAEHQTVLFDLEILLDTIPGVLSGRGAY